MVAVAGVVAASLSTHGLPTALGAAVCCTALLGFANGLVIARVRIPPFIVTLAMMIGARGIALACTGEQSVRVSRLSVGFTTLGRGHVGPVPVPIVCLRRRSSWLGCA
jgi:ribose/xylose/arabinose/galactoside ABC-type transport system permease subunit